MHTLVIADDESNQREGMCRYIDWGALGFTVAASFSDGAELIGYIAENRVDVILTDIMMLNVSGLDVAAYVQERCPGTAVVLISGYKEFAYAQRALELGVKRYVVKPASLEEIREIFFALGKELDERKERDAAEDSIPVGEELLPELQDVVIVKAKEYIQANYMRDISLNDIADHVFLSPVYFSRFFKQKTGVNYVDYLLELRVKQAISLLATGKWRIYEVGGLVGYNSTKYFTRVFKGFTGYSPKDYLRKIIAGKNPGGGD